MTDILTHKGSYIVRGSFNRAFAPTMNEANWIQALKTRGYCVINNYPLGLELDSILPIIMGKTYREFDNGYFGANSRMAWNVRKKLEPVFSNLWPCGYLVTSIEGIQKVTRTSDDVDLITSNNLKHYGMNMCLIRAYIALDDQSTFVFLDRSNQGEGRPSDFNSVCKVSVVPGQVLVYDSRLYSAIVPSTEQYPTYGIHVSMQPVDQKNSSKFDQWRTARAEVVLSNAQTGPDCFGPAMKQYAQETVQTPVLKALSVSEVRELVGNMAFM